MYKASPLAGFGAPGLIGKSRAPRSGQYLVYYVNGMKGNPYKHQAQAGLVAAFSGGPVWGVYNAPGGFFVDVVQCGRDKLTAFKTMETIVAAKGGKESREAREALIAFLKGERVRIGTRQVHVRYIKFQPLFATGVEEAQGVRNLATAALFQRLSEPKFADTRIIAHSQGNLITANALAALAAWKGENALKEITVYAVASPQWKWPRGSKIVPYAFANDAVAYLGSGEKGPSYLSDVVVAEYDRQTEEILRYGPAPKLCLPRNYAFPFYEFGWGADLVCAPVPQLTHNFYSYVEYYWDQLVGYFP